MDQADTGLQGVPGRREQSVPVSEICSPASERQGVSGRIEQSAPMSELCSAATEPGRREHSTPDSGPGQRAHSSCDPGRSISRGDFLCPSERWRLEREEPHRANEHTNVLSDSENEEPISRRIRNISAFIRKTSSALSRGGQRSRSSEPVEEKKTVKVLLQPTILQVGAPLSLTAGILLSSENSRSVSAPLPPLRRLAWSAVMPASQWERGVVMPTSQGERGASSLVQSERSVSPDSNDSISEELNHFKPIVSSPCTPPRRLADGRIQEATVIKSTPRNLRGMGGATVGAWPQSSVLMQKWRQIELDRQLVTAAMERRCAVSVATLTSPVTNSRNQRRRKFTRAEEVPRKVHKPHGRHEPDALEVRSNRKRQHRAVQRLRPQANDNAVVNAKPRSYDKLSAKANANAQERADRALALQLQRHFDGVPDPYFLRSANQSAEGRSLRRRHQRHKD
ncbi:unnamed protein product [Knipowitschia caucasica]|uniref:RING-type E3 ubiquitin transferase n=1 Tax=Knipowitschia caucasica TaxID=637954 RepID=A0AAV2J176_KNICA